MLFRSSPAESSGTSTHSADHVEGDSSTPPSDMAAEETTPAKRHQSQLRFRNIKSAPPSSSLHGKAALRLFYGMMSTKSISNPIQTQSALLIEHYFREICPILSMIDTVASPFRRLAATSWQRSAPMYFAMQSMAAAHRAARDSGMRVTGLRLR